MIRSPIRPVISGAANESRKPRFGALLIALFFSIAVASAQPRLAIIPEETSLGSVADVLTAQFTKQNQVTLLERDQIQKVYREQALSAGNADYLKLGHVLGADGLLLLRTSTEGTNEYLNARLVAVKPGVLLTAEKFLWPITNLEEWSAAFAQHANRSAPKLTVLEKDALPISVINLRSAVSSPAGLEAEGQLKLLTIDRLSLERQVFVLERERMELLSDENQLKGLDDSTFWSGSYLLEGVIDRDGYSEGRMTINARLTPPRGGGPIEVEVSGKRDDLAGLTDQLVKKVIAALNLKLTVPAWNAGDEAEQFLAEGKWALRWDLYNEARAAGESAWALGKKSRDVAVLRVWAYARTVDVVNEGFGNVTIPFYPDPLKLPSAIRAADLFCEEAPLWLTNSNGVDGEMFSQGIYVFRTAAALLDGFYTTAEMRSGNEDQLAELRRLARQVQQILDPKVDLARSNQWWGNRYNELNAYGQTKWEEGGVIFDKPEDSLPLYQQMLETGYSTGEPLRIVGWSWADRKRVPEIRKRFVAELSESTNAAVCLREYCLLTLQTEFYPEAAFHAREKALLDALWNHRNWIFKSGENAALLTEAEDILSKKYGRPGGSIPFHDEPFFSWKQNLRKTYFTTQTNFNPQVVQILCGSMDSAEQARELVPLMETLPKTNWQIGWTYDHIRQLAGLSPQNVPPPKPIMPAEKPFVARFVSWNGSAFDATPFSKPQVQNMIVREGRLWVEIQPVQQQQIMPSSSGTFYAAIDPTTGSCETIPLPEDLAPYPVFDVTADSIYVPVQDHIERYRRREKRWQAVPCTFGGSAQITEFHGRLYVSTPDSLLEVEPDSGAVQILASARRKPAANEMDSLMVDGSHEFFRAGERLFLEIGKRIFSYMPTNKTWQPLPELPSPMPKIVRKRYNSSAGAMLFTGFPVMPDRLMGLWVDSPSPQLLLEKHVEFEKTNSALDRLLGQPCWDWPRPFKLDFSCVIADGKSFWMLHPRTVFSYGHPPEEPVAFQDDRHATLLHFEPGNRQATTVAIRFEKDGQPQDAFDRRYVMYWPQPFAMPAPIWTMYPEGFVVCSQNLMGHWLIPRNEIKSHLSVLKFETPKTTGPQ
jgi:hypothetical protein